ncbi:MAG TPA: threonine--tRNA ligase [Candidatus Wildermuthbacteria bacterium]|nr:threonine--tRNA ligase [Candidatus Wildermuthbacteria bacterium]
MPSLRAFFFRYLMIVLVNMEDIDHIRHSLAHVLAAAIKNLYPKAKFGIGPTIENGFYYDFDNITIIDKDLVAIEREMRKIISKDNPFKKQLWPYLKAKNHFKKEKALYKVELIEDLKKDSKKKDFKVGMVHMGELFLDLCRGGHVKSTNELAKDAFKLTSIAKAYWKGDEKRPQLTRIYGVAFQTKKELSEYLNILKQAEKKDHRKLGQKLGLFFFHETAPGMPYWLPKGLKLYNELISFWRKEHEKNGYQEITTPLLNKDSLYKISGHWEHYLENMFVITTQEDEVYGLKAMNCPNAMIVYDFEKRSYRDLPLRLSDAGILHRYERSGTLNGLFRVREFRQDDSHTFLTEDQVKDEYKNILELVEKFYSAFNLSYSLRLGTRPKKYMGDAKSWNKAEKELKEILKSSKKPFTVSEGDGTFYGPKIDILMKDSLGRDWQTGTIQTDFQIPKNFKLTYTDSNGKDKTPVTIHKAIFGSLERFIGILIEHYTGAFPLWLSPEQIWILPLSDTYNKKAEELKTELLSELGDLRIIVKDESETLGRKIRDGELQKIPYILVLGEKEVKQKVISVRERGKGDLGVMAKEKFIKKISKEIEDKL